MFDFLKTSIGKIYRYAREKGPRVFSNQRQNLSFQDTPNERQRALLSLIDNALTGCDEKRISYCSEWLGYLPYGHYHWIGVNGRDISSQVSAMDHISMDLQQLVSLGKLKLTKGDFDEWRQNTSEDICIELTWVCS